MAYTSEELNAAIDNIVRTSIRFEYDSLGTRKVGTSFNDLQDAAAGVFVSFPNAPFYVVRLGADRLVDLVAQEADAVGDFISTVRHQLGHGSRLELHPRSDLPRRRGASLCLWGTLSSSDVVQRGLQVEWAYD